ncbi:MAG: hypothetical protein AAFU41_18585, partial [Pseudomonadota bacterium]
DLSGTQPCCARRFHAGPCGSGRDVQRAAIAAMGAPMQKMIGDLGTDTVGELLPGLERLRRYLDENRGV